MGKSVFMRSRLSLSGIVSSEFVRILVIEDEVKLATHLSRALETEGHEARVVHDGKVALIEARDGNYELLILDVELPRMDGFEILRQLRTSGVATRVLMLTARSENPDKIAGLTGGADDYLTKPFAMNAPGSGQCIGPAICCAAEQSSSCRRRDVERLNTRSVAWRHDALSCRSASVRF